MTRYYIRLPDAQLARGSEPALSFTAHGADEFASQLQQALRTDALFERWRMAQDDPDAVDPAFGLTDPGATVTGTQDDLHVDLVATTSLSGDLLRHRMRLLAGSHWELRNVAAA